MTMATETPDLCNTDHDNIYPNKHDSACFLIKLLIILDFWVCSVVTRKWQNEAFAKMPTIIFLKPYTNFPKIITFVQHYLLREAVCCWDNPAVWDDGSSTLVNSIVLQADLPRPTALPGIHTTNYTVCCKTTPATVCRGERGERRLT